MKTLSIYELYLNAGRLDQLVVEEGELMVTRHGRPVARVLPMPGHRKFSDHADLRLQMERLKTPSVKLIRAERDQY